MASGLVYLYNVTSTGQPNEFNLQFAVTPGQQFFQYDKFISPTQQILEIVTAPTGTVSSGSLTVKLLNVNTNVPSVVNQGNYFAIEHTPNHKLGQAKTLVTLMNNIDRYIAYLNANKFLIDSVIPTNYEILQKLGYDEVSGNLLIDSNALAKQIDLHEHDNKTTIDKITEDGSNLPLWNGSEWPNNTNNMLKTIYDTNDDGIVNSAETLNGLLSTVNELNMLQGVTDNVQTQLNNKQDVSEKGQPDGYASLDTNNRVPLTEVYPHTLVVSDLAARDALVSTIFDVESLRVYVEDTSEEFIRHNNAWVLLQSSTNSIDWVDITNKPTSFVSDIDDAVAKKHDHTNKLVLDATEESFTTVLKDKYDSYETDKQGIIEKGQPDGYASLDNNGKVPLSQLPDSTKGQTFVVLDETERLALDTLSLIAGDKVYETNTGDSYIWNGSSWLILAKADWENVSLDWSNITNKPTALVTDIDDAVAKKHEHTNKDSLDLITKDVDDKPLWDGNEWPYPQLNTLFFEEEDPTTQGNDGDMYINTVTWDVWIKESGGWVSKGTLKAESGELPAALQKIGMGVDNLPTWDGQPWPNTLPINGNAGEFLILNEFNEPIWANIDINQVIAWNDITDKPTSLVTDIDDAVSKKHEHTNKDSLDLITKDVNDDPLWNGNPWPGGTGNGDMLKTTYDVNDNGIVDRAEVADSVDWNNIFNKPTDLADGHNHDNKSVLDKITEDISGLPLWDGTEWPGSVVAWNDITDKPTSLVTDIDDAVSKKHEHTNKALLDTYTQTDVDLIDAVNKKHEHTNKLVLDATEESFTTILKDKYDLYETDKQNVSEKGIADGYASLDNTGKVPLSQLPDSTKGQTFVVLDETERLAINTTSLLAGDKAYETSTGDSYIWSGTAWLILSQANWENVNIDWINIVNKPVSSVSQIDDAVTNTHIHNNKNVLDLTEESFTTTLKTSYDDAVLKAHLHSNKIILDATQESFTTVLKANYDDAFIKAHVHSNAAILDDIQEAFTTVLKTSYDDAVTKAHTHTNKAILDIINQDGSNKPTWNGAAWPTGGEDHTLLINHNLDSNYLHITQTEKDKYDHYEQMLLDLQAVISTLEDEIEALKNPPVQVDPVSIGQSTINTQTDITVNSILNVDFPLTNVNEAFTYDIDLAKITTTPNNIITGTISMLKIGEDYVLRVPVTPTLYNETYTVNVTAGAISYNAVGNTDVVETTFTTEAALAPTIANSVLDGQTDVSIASKTLTYAVSSASVGSILALANASAVTAVNATIDSVTLNGNQLEVAISGLTNEQEVSITIGAGTITNSGTPNTVVVTTTFNTAVASGSPYEWEYETTLSTGQTLIDVHALVAPEHIFSLEDFYGPAYDGVNKTVELLWFGYVGNILHPNGSPVATSVETWTHETFEGKVDYDNSEDSEVITFAGGSLGDKIYKIVRHHTPITRS